MSNFLVINPINKPTIPASKIHKLNSKFLKYNDENPELSTAKNVDIEFIIGTIIARNVRGIIKLKSKNCGKLPPNNIPVRVAICHDVNKVNHVTKR